MKPITLYPGSWLYNAGITGLLRVLEELCEDVDAMMSNSSTLQLSINKSKEEIFNKWVELSPKRKEGKSLVYGWKGAYYANQTEGSIKKRIEKLISPPSEQVEKPSKQEKIEKLISPRVYSCMFCSSTFVSRKQSAVLNQAFSNTLLGSEKTFGNMYWCNKARDYICPKCEFIIMCHHLAFIPLNEGSEIFINAPSFRIMHYLNKLACQVVGSTSKEEIRTTREILAMTVIEYAMRVQTMLGVWAGMNVEVVVRRKETDQIEFFSLPSEIVRLLSQRDIASILSQIGEFYILNEFLKGHFSELIELGYRLLRIGLRRPAERAKSETKYVNNILRIERNRQNPKRVAEEVFRLCSLIHEMKGGGA